MKKDPEPSAAASPQPAAPPALAAIIASRATDLLAIGLVLMVGLSSGRQIVAWWRAAPAPVPTASEADSLPDWDARQVDLSFGAGAATLSRRIVQGDRRAAEQALARLCAELAARMELPIAPVSEEEASWLARVETLVAEPTNQAAHDAVYLPPAPLPLAIAVRASASGRANRRVTATAWAFPQGETRWLLYAMPLAGRAAGPGLPAAELPPGASPILGWRDERGASVIAFDGSAPLDDWVAHFRQQQAKVSLHGDQASATVRHHQGDQVWDYQLRSTNEGTSGVCWCLPKTLPMAESPETVLPATPTPRPDAVESANDP